MKLYKTVAPLKSNLLTVINFLPYISLYYRVSESYVNIGWLIWTIQIKIK